MDEEYEYAVEFTTTVKVKAPDVIEAVEKAREMVSMDDMDIFVGGNLY